MKFLTLIAMFNILLIANPQNIDFYNKSANNQLLCKFTPTTYKLINKTNSSIKEIHKTLFFKLNDENLYINSNSCHPIKKEDTAIIF